MYGVGNADDGGGIRISAPAHTAPGLGFDGMIEAVAYVIVVPFGCAGMFCTLKVEASS